MLKSIFWEYKLKFLRSLTYKPKRSQTLQKNVKKQSNKMINQVSFFNKNKFKKIYIDFCKEKIRIKANC